MYTTIGTYSCQMTACCPGQIATNQDNRQSSKKNNKHQLLYTYGCTSDDGPRYARNMQKLKKYTKNKLRIKLFSLYTNNKTFLTVIDG